MNTFADSLFTALFSWVRSLVQGIWSSVVNGRFSSFFSWLGDHWFWLVLGLCLIGTVIDFIIWLIRWRPYLVWRTNMRRLMRRLRGEKDDSLAFETGYADGVALDLPTEAEGQDQNAPTWDDQAFQQPVVFPEEFSFSPQPVMEENVPPVENDPPSSDALPYFMPQEYSAVPEQAPIERVTGPRRRRSDKHIQQKKASWHDRLVADDADQDALLDGLPPAVDREQAFHEPVYPQASANYSSWKKPENHQTNG